MSMAYFGAGVLAALVVVSPAMADPLHPFVGTWGGTGRVVVDDGKSEQIRCKGYYRPTEGQKGLGIAIRCASASYSIQLRSALTINGSQISGSWEERTFNVQGQLSGRVDGGRMVLNVDGGGLKAAMTIAVSGSSQSVVLTTQGSGLKEVRMALARAQ
jgi:hypothetical protein